MEEDNKSKEVALISNEGAGELLSAVASMVAIPPTPIYSGKREGKPQRMGPPVLSGRRLERLKKSMKR